jgi:hypothetical protein
MKASGKQLSTGPKHGLKKPKQLKGSTGKPQAPVASKPVVGSPEWKKTYPHGEYSNAGYHTDKGTPLKSPRPKSGQECLNKSFEIPNSPHRIAIEDGKIVVLRITENNGHPVYHGYVVDNYHALKDTDMQQALIRNGLVKDGKTGRII